MNRHIRSMPIFCNASLAHRNLAWRWYVPTATKHSVTNRGEEPPMAGNSRAIGTGTRVPMILPQHNGSQMCAVAQLLRYNFRYNRSHWYFYVSPLAINIVHDDTKSIIYIYGTILKVSPVSKCTVPHDTKVMRLIDVVSDDSKSIIYIYQPARIDFVDTCFFAWYESIFTYRSGDTKSIERFDTINIFR